MENRTYWIFQYTNKLRVDEELRSGSVGDVIHWPWSELSTEPQPGDIVFFFRSGPPRKGHPRRRYWRGFTGVGIVARGPGAIPEVRTERGVLVETIAYLPEDPVSDWLVWHDHRVADVRVLFGQQGGNFTIGQPAARALAHAMLTNARPGEAGVSLLQSIDPEPGDTLTRYIEGLGGWVDNHAARGLQAARALSVRSTRRGKLTWTHLLIGLVLAGREVRSDARTSALALILSRLAAPNYNETPFNDYLGRLTGQEDEKVTIDRRDVGPLDGLSQSASKVIRLASELAGDDLVIVDNLISALFSASAHHSDEVFDLVFQSDRDTVIDRLIEEGRERCWPEDLERFAASLGRTVAPVESDGQPPQANAAPQGPRVAGTLNDTVKRGEDFLDVRREAEAFARLIASNGFEPPLAIGVFGHWGTGKTFFMERIAEALDDLTDQTSRTSPNGPSVFHGKIVRIRFNAWHYMETNVWASLVDVIFKELDGWLRRSVDDENSGKNVEKLFKSLSTAQAERLEAIEVFAARLRHRELARQTLQDASTGALDHWTAVAKEIVDQEETGKAFDQVVEAFGLKDLADRGAELQAAIKMTQESASDAKLLWTSARARAASPAMLVLLTALVLGAPLLLAWLGSHIDIAPTVSTLTGLVTAATAWVNVVAVRTKSVVGALRQVKAAFDKAEAKRAEADRETLTHYETKISEARTALTHAEQEAATALQNLQAGSATGRIAAFIRSRAEGDTYAKHLGIIDTIRRDFEQLTALMASSQEQAEQEIKALERQQKDLAMRIEALRARYLGKDASEADKELFRPVGDALDLMLDANLPKNPLGVSIDRIVLFIDDLDRCPPDKVYRVLQAIHLFLNFPLFVMVVGVDTRWMETSLIKELGSLVDGSRGTSAQDYLEKIFQIPYWTRRMDSTASRSFVGGVLQQIPTELPSDPGRPEQKQEASEEDTQPTNGPAERPVREERADEPEGEPGGDEEEPDDEPDRREEERTGPLTRPVVITEDERETIRLLAPQAGRSPRQLLRFVNVYGLIKSVMGEGGEPLIDPERDPMTYQALLAQLAIATGSPTSAHIYFDALAACAGDLTKLRSQIEARRLTTSPIDDDMENLRTVLRNSFRNVGLLPEEPGEAGSWPDVNDERAKSFLVNLQETAPIARRYTFAAIDAVLPAPPRDGASE